MYVQIFCLFLYWVNSFFIIVFLKFLIYVMWLPVLEEIYILWTFFSSLWLPFHLLSSVFEEQDYLVLFCFCVFWCCLFVCFVCFAYGYPISSTISWKKLSFLHWINFAPLSKINWPYKSKSISGLSILYHWSIGSFFHQIPHCRDYYYYYYYYYSKSWNQVAWVLQLSSYVSQ